MIKEIYLPKGTYLYDDKGNRYPKKINNGVTVTVLSEDYKAFRVTFPTIQGVPYAFVLKKEIGYTNPETEIELQTGDTMILSDKNGRKLGVWTFKKE